MLSETSNDQVLGNGLSSIHWASACREMGLQEIILVQKNMPIGFRLHSKILEGKYEPPSEYEQDEEEEYKYYPFGYETAEKIIEVEKRVGVDSFQTITHHGVLLYCVIFNSINNGGTGFARGKDGNMVFLPDRLHPQRTTQEEKIDLLSQINDIFDLKEF